MILEAIFSIFAYSLESIIEYEIELICPLTAFIFTTHKVAIHEHHIGIVQLKSHYHSAFISGASAQSGLDLGRFKVFDSAQ